MDFFQSQDVARRKTGLLVFYFAASVVLMIIALYAAAVFGLSFAGGRSEDPSAAMTPVSWWQPDLLLVVAVGVIGIVGSGSLYKTFELRGGGESVATMLGGRQLNANTTDLAERRLLNVVEEMALASGIAVPPVYVLDKEEGINAFAAGFTPEDAVIGVNRGTIDYLTRDELQGVIAHEFSHILNGDMRLNVRLIGILYGILLLSVIGYYALRVGAFSGAASRGKKGSGAAPVLIMGLAALVVGSIGLLFGRLIKAAVSRQREYLADASAVQFTRNPAGIAGALKKIGGLSSGSKMHTPEAESASHMFFGNALRQNAHSPLATHPPLVERIRRIDPQFDGKFPRVKSVREQPARDQRAAAQPAPQPAHRPGFGRVLGGLGAAQRMPIDPLLVLGAIGAPQAEHVQYSGGLLEAMPPELRDAVHEPFSARTAIFALLLDPEEPIRRHQLDLVEQREGQPSRRETERLRPFLEQMGTAARLPLIELAQGTLQQMTPEQFLRFQGTIDQLVQADEKISLFEFVLQRVLLRHLRQHFRQQRSPRVRYHSLAALGDETALLLSAMVHVGHRDPAAARDTYAEANAALDSRQRTGELLAGRACTISALGDALDRLALASPAIKRRVLHAAAVAVTADGQVTLGEAELLRAVAASLDCPMPPILPAGGAS